MALGFSTSMVGTCCVCILGTDTRGTTSQTGFVAERCTQHKAPFLGCLPPEEADDMRIFPTVSYGLFVLGRFIGSVGHSSTKGRKLSAIIQTFLQAPILQHLPRERQSEVVQVDQRRRNAPLTAVWWIFVFCLACAGRSGRA